MVKILWVDDEIELLKPHVLFLRGKGYEVDTCNNGYDAIDMATEGNYDLIILDPPAFAKSGAAVRSAARGYKDINLQMMKKCPKGTLLLTCSCSRFIDPDLFQKVIFSAASDAKRDAQIIRRTGHPADHPVNLNHPETEYLKGILLYVV